MQIRMLKVDNIHGGFELAFDDDGVDAVAAAAFFGVDFLLPLFSTISTAKIYLQTIQEHLK